MRLPRRVLFSLHGVLAFLLVAGFGFSLSAQSPAINSDSLPAKWNEAVTTLANKIAAASGAARTLALQMKNISSLNSMEASSIESALETELKQRGLRIVASTRAGAEVNITLSEGAEGFVWVAEIIRGDSRQVVMAATSKVLETAGRENQNGVILEKSLVWEQPDRFLDFAILPAEATGGSQRVLILEANRLAYYTFFNENWKFDRAIATSNVKVTTRDSLGFIGPEAQEAVLEGAQCGKDLSRPGGVTCVGKNPSVKFRISPSIEILGQAGDDATEIRLNCAGTGVALATGPGDWTQPDWIQAYLASPGRAQASGAPIQTEGPVTSLIWTGTPGEARAVVHNLKTGNYEGYIVTATCSH
jgi:hypothetical protein